jgi:hypothetical protein
MHPLEGRLELKFFAEDDRMPDPSEFVPVFHRWIQIGRLPGELLIDVADYSHVHHGPGVVLVGHQASYAIDHGEGRPGLLCRLTRFPSRDGASRLRALFRRGLGARVLLQEEPAVGGRFRLRDDEMRLRVLDRRAAPNRESTFAAVERELSPFLAGIGDRGVRLEPRFGSREPFAVRIAIDGGLDPKEIVQRLETSELRDDSPGIQLER